MERTVYKVPSFDEGVEGAPPGPASEPPAGEKLLKYFPAEALALYSALDPAVRATFEDDSLKVALWASLVIGVIFCFLFLKQFWHVTRNEQILISCGAFVLYVAALGGPFETLDWWKPGIAVIASILATAFLIFVPSPSLPAPPGG